VVKSAPEERFSSGLPDLIHLLFQQKAFFINGIHDPFLPSLAVPYPFGIE
jgi:hypothetical protein